MPWVKEEDCIGCGTCVEECPVDAISMENEKAHIDMALCIRCGTCHDVCPEEAVRHDSERIPIEIEANMEYTNRLMQHFESEEEKREFLGRMIKHFNKEKVVAEKTIGRVKMLREQI
jgi:ferredoxin